MKKSRKSTRSPDETGADFSSPAPDTETGESPTQTNGEIADSREADPGDPCATGEQPATSQDEDQPAESQDAGPDEDLLNEESPTEYSEESANAPEPPPEGLPLRPLVDVIEAILFASQKPVSSKELRTIFKGAGETGDPAAVHYAKIKEPEFREALSELALSLQERGSTYEVRETAAGWQLMTRPDFSPWLRQLFPENRPARLSAPALETLAIIAYRQPITRADIEAVRGVAVDGVMQTLLDRGLIRIGGRAEIAGRPLLYETTQFFMEHFGLRDLDELPNAAELRKIALPTAEPPTAEPPTAEPPTAEPPTAETPTAKAPPAQVPDQDQPAPTTEPALAIEIQRSRTDWQDSGEA